MKPLTQDQINQLVEIVYRMRTVAEPYGSPHGWWDLIVDCESVLTGKEPYLQEHGEDVNKLIAECQFCITKRDWDRAAGVAYRLGVFYSVPQPKRDSILQ